MSTSVFIIFFRLLCICGITKIASPSLLCRFSGFSGKYQIRKATKISDKVRITKFHVLISIMIIQRLPILHGEVSLIFCLKRQNVYNYKA